MGIEFDTENSCRKYQVCKQVAPRRNRNRSDSVAVFRVFRAHDFGYIVSGRYRVKNLGNAILAYLYLYVDVLSITHRLEKVFCKATEGTLIIDKIEKGTVCGRSGFSEGELRTITEGEFLLYMFSE